MEAAMKYMVKDPVTKVTIKTHTYSMHDTNDLLCSQ